MFMSQIRSKRNQPYRATLYIQCKEMIKKELLKIRKDIVILIMPDQRLLLDGPVASFLRYHLKKLSAIVMWHLLNKDGEDYKHLCWSLPN